MNFPIYQPHMYFHQGDADYIDTTYDDINQTSLDVIANSYIEFDNTNNFGIVKLKMKKMEITKTPTFFLLTIDKTGSMSEKIDKNTTKMDVVKQTVKNMIHYFSKLDAPIYIRIHTFNTEVETTIDCTRITPDIANDVISKIDAIEPESPTNIGVALQSADETMKSYAFVNPSHQICHIFMTDGDATEGELNRDVLASRITEDYPTINVGFGLSHNVKLLKTLSQKKNADYQFVNNMETTSVIYAEAVHRYLYPCVHNVDIVMENALIYDWKTNEWAASLHEPVIVGEVEKIYHVKRCPQLLETKEIPLSGTNEIVARIYGIVPRNEPKNDQKNHRQLLDSAIELPPLVDANTFESVSNLRVDLTPYMYRQRTLELLFESQHVSSSTKTDAVGHIKTQLNDLYKEIKQYMDTSNLGGEFGPFLKQLCDDIYITYRFLGTEHGAMYTLARYTSQGRQQSHSATPRQSEIGHHFSPLNDYDSPPALSLSQGLSRRNLTVTIPSTPRVKRQTTNSGFGRGPGLTTILSESILTDLDDNDDYINIQRINNNDFTNDLDTNDLDNYCYDDADSKTCYATPSQIDTMNEMTNNA
jgi:hypothetical protein